MKFEPYDFVVWLASPERAAPGAQAVVEPCWREAPLKKPDLYRLKKQILAHRFMVIKYVITNYHRLSVPATTGAFRVDFVTRYVTSDSKATQR